MKIFNQIIEQIKNLAYPEAIAHADYHVDIIRNVKRAENIVENLVYLKGFTSSISKIAQERLEHSSKHGHLIYDDVENNKDAELLHAALALLGGLGEYPKKWDKKLCKKMESKPHEEKLIIAASLLAAEYDRLKYLEKYGDNLR